MSLRTATLLALIGTSINLLWMLVIGVPRILATGVPAIHRFSMFPSLFLQLTFLLFFATLLKKQRSGSTE